MKVTVPTSWNDVSVDKYQLLKTLDRKDFKTDLNYTIVLVDILCGIDAKDISLEKFNEIAGHLTFLGKEVKADKKEWLSINGKVFKWVADFNSLSVGEMLSIEQIIDMEELSYNLSVDVIAAVLLRPEGEGFNSDSFNERR